METFKTLITLFIAMPTHQYCIALNNESSTAPVCLAFEKADKFPVKKLKSQITVNGIITC